MVTIADILALPAFSEVSIVAPCEGAGKRVIHNVGILDCPPDYNGYTNYFPGELILTNLGFANGDDEVSEKSLIALIDRHVAGIAVKTVYNPSISEAVREESTREGVPVYVYDGAYHEVVAYQALDLIQKDAHDLDKTGQVEALLYPRKPQDVCASLLEICGATGAEVQFVAALAAGDDGFSTLCAISSIQHACERIEGRFADVTKAGVFRYGEHVMCVLSFLGEKPAEVASGRANNGRVALDAMRQAVLSEGPFFCGVSERLELSKGDICLREALGACNRAVELGEHWLSWDMLGQEAFRLAARGDALFGRAADTLVSRIAAYDEQNGTELMDTLRAFLACGGEVSATAERLYQHPNTIRYRLRKVKALVGDATLTDRRLLVVVSLMFLPEDEGR